MGSNQLPHVSIITVNYNNTDDTLSCIESINKLTYDNYSVIVVDNGSTDDSTTILKENSSSYNLLINEKNEGYPAGANTGIKHAIESGSEYILLINNDTEIPENSLKLLVQTLENNDNAAAASGIIRYMDDESVQYAGGYFNNLTGKLSYTTEIEQETTYETDGILGAFVLARAEFLRKINGLDEQFFFGHDDIDLSYEIRKRGWKILVNPDVSIYHKGRGVADTMTGFLSYYSCRNQLYFIKKHLELPYNITALLYLFISRVGLLIKGADFIGSRSEFLMVTLWAIVDEFKDNDLRKPEFF